VNLRHSGANLAKTVFPSFGRVNKAGRRIWIMAKEIKSISVAPSAEEETINLWQSFGWEFKSTQEIKTQAVQLYTGQSSDGTKHYRTTKGDHYVKLTFERDPTRQNYAELKSLEEQYYSIKSINKPYYPIEPKRFGLLWGIIAVIGLAWIIPGVIIIIWRCASYPKKKKLYDEAYAVYSRECEVYNREYEVVRKKKQELLKKAKSLA